MKCLDCKKEAAGFLFGSKESGTFLCFKCLSKRADMFKADPANFKENIKKMLETDCCCDSRKDDES